MNLQDLYPIHALSEWRKNSFKHHKKSPHLQRPNNVYNEKTHTQTFNHTIEPNLWHRRRLFLPMITFQYITADLLNNWWSGSMATTHLTLLTHSHRHWLKSEKNKLNMLINATNSFLKYINVHVHILYPTLVYTLKASRGRQ